jgi:hypothetical protein
MAENATTGGLRALQILLARKAVQIHHKWTLWSCASAVLRELPLAI